MASPPTDPGRKVLKNSPMNPRRIASATLNFSPTAPTRTYQRKNVLMMGDEADHEGRREVAPVDRHALDGMAAPDVGQAVRNRRRRHGLADQRLPLRPGVPSVPTTSVRAGFSPRREARPGPLQGSSVCGRTDPTW